VWVRFYSNVAQITFGDAGTEYLHSVLAALWSVSRSEMLRLMGGNDVARFSRMRTEYPGTTSGYDASTTYVHLLTGCSRGGDLPPEPQKTQN
jgi:hypothetical protein